MALAQAAPPRAHGACARNGGQRADTTRGEQPLSERTEDTS